MVPFPMIFSDPNLDFKGTPLFDVEYLRNGTIQRHGVPIGYLALSLIISETKWDIQSKIAKCNEMQYTLFQKSKPLDVW